MPKEHKRTNAVKIIGKIDPLVNLVANNKNDAQSLISLVTVEGPPHKQWQHTLVLHKIQKLLLKKIKQKRAKVVATSKENIVAKKHNEKIKLPIGFPKSAVNTTYPKLLKELSKGPEHEIAYTALLLQAIEWLDKLD